MGAGGGGGGLCILKNEISHACGHSIFWNSSSFYFIFTHDTHEK
jgi:hypothetical protein